MKLLFALIPVVFASQVLACAPGEGALSMSAETQTDMVAFLTLGPQSLSQPFDLTLLFCGEKADTLTAVDVSAAMPAHQHGMNYEPRVAQVGDGEFTVSGMLFHMPGDWRIEVEARTEEKPLYFTLDVAAQ